MQIPPGHRMNLSRTRTLARATLHTINSHNTTWFHANTSRLLYRHCHLLDELVIRRPEIPIHKIEVLTTDNNSLQRHHWSLKPYQAFQRIYLQRCVVTGITEWISSGVVANLECF